MTLVANDSMLAFINSCSKVGRGGVRTVRLGYDDTNIYFVANVNLLHLY